LFAASHIRQRNAVRVEPQFNQLNYPPLIFFLSQPKLILGLFFYELLIGLCFALSRKLAAYLFAVAAIIK
jgi:hypothetical protein